VLLPALEDVVPHLVSEYGNKFNYLMRDMVGGWDGPELLGDSIGSP